LAQGQHDLGSRCLWCSLFVPKTASPHEGPAAAGYRVPGLERPERIELGPEETRPGGLAASVYDLGEEEQLSLAIERSLNEDGGLAGGPMPAVPMSARSRGPPELTGGYGVMPEMVVVGGDGGGGPDTPARPLSASSSSLPPPRPLRYPGGVLDDPERVGAAAEEAAGGGPSFWPSWGSSGMGVFSSSGVPDEAGGDSGSYQAAAAAWTAAPAPVPVAAPYHSATAAPPAGGLPAAVEMQVKQALELATARQFEEAEQCLAEIATAHPGHAGTKEVLAAWEAVTMCKQFCMKR